MTTLAIASHRKCVCTEKISQKQKEEFHNETCVCQNQPRKTTTIVKRFKCVEYETPLEFLDEIHLQNNEIRNKFFFNENKCEENKPHLDNKCWNEQTKRIEWERDRQMCESRRSI